LLAVGVFSWRRRGVSGKSSPDSTVEALKRDRGDSFSFWSDENAVSPPRLIFTSFPSFSLSLPSGRLPSFPAPPNDLVENSRVRSDSISFLPAGWPPLGLNRLPNPFPPPSTLLSWRPDSTISCEPAVPPTTSFPPPSPGILPLTCTGCTVSR